MSDSMNNELSKSYRQEPTCRITELELTESLLPEYLSSLRWTSYYDPKLMANGKPIQHGQTINGQIFSAVISNDCNNILVQYGRRVVIRQASGLQLRLDCHHHNHVRKTKPETAGLSEQKLNAKNAQVLVDVLSDQAKKNALKKKRSTGKSIKNSNEPKQKGTRKTVSKQIGCTYALKFV